MKRSILACLVLLAGFSSTSLADVTGDFKVTGSGFSNDAASVSGTVNHGAIQSKKSVVVDLTYDYSFVAVKEVAGETITTTVFVPGKCITAPSENASACFDRDGNPKAVNGAIWTGTYETSTTTTDPQTLQQVFNGVSGMVAITEPTIEKGRLNPKGKITGYNWTSTQSIVPNADIVDPALIPEGFDVISVTINSITYSAYLVDAYGLVIADTVTNGILSM